MKIKLHSTPADILAHHQVSWECAAKKWTSVLLHLVWLLLFPTKIFLPSLLPKSLARPAFRGWSAAP